MSMCLRGVKVWLLYLVAVGSDHSRNTNSSHIITRVESFSDLVNLEPEVITVMIRNTREIKAYVTDHNYVDFNSTLLCQSDLNRHFITHIVNKIHC